MKEVHLQAAFCGCPATTGLMSADVDAAGPAIASLLACFTVEMKAGTSLLVAISDHERLFIP